jgi:uncharacterized repeat protein (TIGR04076 family)
MANIKITVLRRTIEKDLVDEYIKPGDSEFGPCELFEDGQEFLLEGFPTIPKGFCDWAWADIQRDVIGIAMGADMPWMMKPGVAVSCCTDGFRPVIFKIERVD